VYIESEEVNAMTRTAKCEDCGKRGQYSRYYQATLCRDCYNRRDVETGALPATMTAKDWQAVGQARQAGTNVGRAMMAGGAF
jgi:hypothetical protein